MAENKISKESAKEQLDLFLDHYEIENEEFNEGEEGYEEYKNLQLVLEVLTKSICKGRIEIKEDSEGIKVSQHLKNKEILTFKEINGAAKVEMDKAKSRGNHGRMYALNGYLTGKGALAIERLEGKDLSTTEALAALFLQE